MTEREDATIQPVLATRTASGETVHLRVFCERRGTSMDVESCRDCAELLGEAHDEGLGVDVLVCTPTLATAAEARVGSALRHGAFSVRASDPAPALLPLLVAQRTVPVLDAGGRLVGEAHEADLVARAVRGMTSRPALGATDLARALAGTTAGQLMTTPLAVPETASVSVALRRLAKAHLRQIPVVTQRGLLLGVVTDLDCLALLGDEP